MHHSTSQLKYNPRTPSRSRCYMGCRAPAFDTGELDALAGACYYCTVASARYPRSDPMLLIEDL